MFKWALSTVANISPLSSTVSLVLLGQGVSSTKKAQ